MVRAPRARLLWEHRGCLRWHRTHGYSWLPAKLGFRKHGGRDLARAATGIPTNTMGCFHLGWSGLGERPRLSRRECARPGVHWVGCPLLMTAIAVFVTAEWHWEQLWGDTQHVFLV